MIDTCNRLTYLLIDLFFKLQTKELKTFFFLCFLCTLVAYACLYLRNIRAMKMKQMQCITKPLIGITDLWLLVEIISLAEDMRDTFEINYLGLKWSGNLTWRHLTSYYCLKAAFQPWHANQSILLIVSKEEIFLLLLLNFYLAPKLNLILAEFLKNKHGWMKTWLGIATRERLCQSHAGPQLHFKLNKNNNTTTLSRVANISCSGNRRKSSSFFSQGCRVLFLLCFVLYFWFAKEAIR